MSAEASAQLLNPHVKRGDTKTGSDWNGYAFEFRLDGNAEVTRIARHGVNAGVASMFAWYPQTDTTIVLLANQDCDVWAMHAEIEQIIAG